MNGHGKTHSRDRFHRGGSSRGGKTMVYRRVEKDAPRHGHALRDEEDDQATGSQGPRKKLSAGDENPPAVVPFRSSLQDAIQKDPKNRDGVRRVEPHDARSPGKTRHVSDRSVVRTRRSDSTESNDSQRSRGRPTGNRKFGHHTADGRKFQLARSMSHNVSDGRDGSPRSSPRRSVRNMRADSRRSVDHDSKSRHREPRPRQIERVQDEITHASPLGASPVHGSTPSRGASPARGSAQFQSSLQRSLYQRKGSTDSVQSTQSVRSEQEKTVMKKWERKLKPGHPSDESKQMVRSDFQNKTNGSAQMKSMHGKASRRVEEPLSPALSSRSDQPEELKDTRYLRSGSLTERSRPSTPTSKAYHVDNGLDQRSAAFGQKLNSPRPQFQSTLRSSLSSSERHREFSPRALSPNHQSGSDTPTRVVSMMRSSQDVRFSSQPSRDSPRNYRTPGESHFSREDQKLRRDVSQDTVDGRSGSRPTEMNSRQIGRFESSLSKSVGRLRDERPSSAGSRVGDLDRKKIKERLQERFAARAMERSSSLSTLNSRINERESRTELNDQHLYGRNNSLNDPDSASNEKNRRTKDFFARLDQDDRRRERARRETPFKSSLLESVMRTQREADSFKKDKIKYSLEKMKSLRPAESSCPLDLPDMRIVETIVERTFIPAYMRSSSMSSSGRGRLGRKRDGRRGKKLESGRKTDKNRATRGVRGRGGRGAPPPPVYDGPVEPLKLSENRWVGNKEKKAVEKDIVSQVKGLLNKLTREKFAKLTKELCQMEIGDFGVLQSIVGTIVDKAQSESSFSDVYADLCREYHKYWQTRPWEFLRSVEDTSGQNYMWTCVRSSWFETFKGPYKSVSDCLAPTNWETGSPAGVQQKDWISSDFLLQANSSHIFAVLDTKDGYYVARKEKDSFALDEPLVGEFKTQEIALSDGLKQTSFRRLLVLRCQQDFEKTCLKVEMDDGKSDQQVDRVAAMQLKRIKLGNMRFIGELFKVDLLKQNVVEQCIFQLLGLKLLDANSSEQAAQTVRCPDEEDVEALCKMLGTVGKKLDVPGNERKMKIIILRLVELSEDANLSSRARFLIKDILEMRDHMWEPRRKELQQKTLEEVRKEAERLQRLGKNAQHDQLSHRRRKVEVSSLQLAKESDGLLLHTPAAAEIAKENESADSEDTRKFSARIKNTIQEYLSILDIEEAAACVNELPRGPCHVEFGEQAINYVLEGKAEERDNATSLLVGLYEKGTLNAASIQLALINAMEFLEDMRIDIPLVHQYCAVIFGRLVAVGCFGLKWMLSEALGHLVESELTSLIFAETLGIIEEESSEETVIRMVADEEINPSSLLPSEKGRDKDQVEKYLKESDLIAYFHPGDEDEDELDPMIIHKLRGSLEEYLSINSLDELVQCVDEIPDLDHAWNHFVRVAIEYGLEANEKSRKSIGSMLHNLHEKKVSNEDVREALDEVISEYEEIRIDVPKLAAALVDLSKPMLMHHFLNLDWLARSFIKHECVNYVGEVIVALLRELEAEGWDQERLKKWLEESVRDANSTAQVLKETFSSVSSSGFEWVQHVRIS